MQHTEYKCPQPCEKIHCQYCDGGLFLCTVCGGGECELTTDCAGFKLDAVTRERVCDGKLDYVDGTWIDPRTNTTV